MPKKSIELEELDKKYDPEPYFNLLDLYFESNKKILIKHHIDSFDQFIREIIPSIVQNNDNVIYEKITEDKIIKYRLTFDELAIKPPSMENDEEYMFPLDAIQKNLTYSSKYTATVTQWQDIIDIATGTKQTIKNRESEKDVPIAKIPIMVGSAYCNLTINPNLSRDHCRYDAGGYFIINGSEKVVLSVESIIHRKPMVFAQKDQNSLIYYVRVQSRPAEQYVGNMQVFTIKIRKDNNIVVVAPRFKEISVFTLMRGLGIESDEDIIDSIADTKVEDAIVSYLSVAMNAQKNQIMTTEQAIETLMNNMVSTKKYSETNPELRAQQKRKHLMSILANELLPHVVSGTNKPELDMLYKAHYIGYMIHKLLKCYLFGSKNVEEFRGCDDRDSMVNKRIEVSGVLLGGLFEQFFKKMLSECNKSFRNKNVDDSNPPNIIAHIKSNPIEQGLRQALTTGSFGSNSRKGISQMLNRLNHLHSASYLRRVITPTVDASKNKMTGPRHLHNTQYGSMCPLETPTGPNTGLVKNMAMLESITINMNMQSKIIQDYLERKIISLELVNKKKLHNYTKIFINGNWIGVTDKIEKIHHELRQMRFKGEIEKSVSLVWDYNNEFHIYTEGGRLIRPYLTVTNNKLNFKPEMLEGITTWDEFIIKYPHVIEFIDKEEEQNIMLAVFPKYIDQSRKIMKSQPLKNVKDIDKINKTNRYDNNVYCRYTHCEIHPSMILGLISTNIPFPDHNQSPRGIFQYNQARQAMGLYISDYRKRTDISYILYHPQIPLVASRASKYTGTNIFPSGENVIVSIMSYTGYNQEDSLLVNNSAIEKGLFRAQALKKYSETIEKNPASTKTSIFMKPDRNKVENMKDANYDKLNEEGYVDVETVIKDGDVIIGLVNPRQIVNDDEKPYVDKSTIYKSLVPGAIDKVITGFNNDMYPIIKIRIRSERIPNIGDKFSCYDDSTQILTQRGWILFNKLSPGDYVATLNNKSKLKYEKPLDIQKYQYNGKMYQIKSSTVDLCVTPNHNMWTGLDGEYKLERIDQIIGKARTYQKSIDDYVTNENKEFILPAFGYSPCHKINMDEWLNFYGLWITSTTVIHNDTITLITHLDATKIIDSFCKNNNYTISYYSKDEQNNHNWQITNKQLANLLGMYTCKFPAWIWNLNKSQSRLLLSSAISGKNDLITNSVYYTNDNYIADNLQILCLHAGFSCDILTNDKNYKYQLNININTFTDNIICQNNIHYNGTVYCCSVPSGIIYVRRNGIPVFCGNSRAGQKGTVGFKPHRADMPFSQSGLIPDIIVNPNAIPKRMTIGQLVECLLSKYCAIKGIYGDATPFEGIDYEAINKELVDAGYEEWGNETMYNGMTGQKISTKIFIGPTYYQRLKQMVGDKTHSRARGPTQSLTRQPPEGRARDGGFRIGEMERDGICAHGAAQLQKERMVDNSDSYSIRICDLCGLFAHKVPRKKYYVCRACQNTTKITKIIIPYAFKLLVHELRSINILCRIRTAKSITIS